MGSSSPICADTFQTTIFETDLGQCEGKLNRGFPFLLGNCGRLVLEAKLMEIHCNRLFSRFLKLTASKHLKLDKQWKTAWTILGYGLPSTTWRIIPLWRFQPSDQEAFAVS